MDTPEANSATPVRRSGRCGGGFAPPSCRNNARHTNEGGVDRVLHKSGGLRIMLQRLPMSELRCQPKYYVAFFEVDKRYKTIRDVTVQAPDAIAEHLARSNALGKKGKLVMAGSFLDRPEEQLTTMGVFYTREDAEEYARGDPFVLNGMVAHWYVREWTSILRE